MGFGTFFKADCYISRKLYKSKDELELEIEELEDYINRSKSKILSLSTSTPRDIYSPDCDLTPLDYVTNECNNELEWLEENINALFLRKLLLDNWDKKEDDI